MYTKLQIYFTYLYFIHVKVVEKKTKTFSQEIQSGDAV